MGWTGLMLRVSVASAIFCVLVIEAPKSRVERVGDLDAEIEHRFDGLWLAGDGVAEGLSLQQFHRDEGAPVGLVDFVNGADAGVVQRGRGFGLALKTAEGLGVVGEIIGKKL